MRAWIGEEREGKDQGVFTMFVEASYLSDNEISTVIELSRKHQVKRVYFGAGRVDLQHDYIRLFRTLQSFKMKVVLETSALNASFWDGRTNGLNEIVLRLDLNYDAKNAKIVPKMDNGKQVNMYYDCITNSLETLKNGLYQDSDKQIY